MVVEGFGIEAPEALDLGEPRLDEHRFQLGSAVKGVLDERRPGPVSPDQDEVVPETLPVSEDRAADGQGAPLDIPYVRQAAVPGEDLLPVQVDEEAAPGLRLARTLRRTRMLSS